ncbi:restriction endonuclease subunit S [Streptococcus suis]|uniref:restriction endonuclease subunit S n=1 Tax=Streptococcus suis TaxID=1307 RepID=UPI000CF5075A|nr:restriction endonuclease subunit S [Streptococcus suis]
MKTNNNIPAYRFQGYTDAWELRKLGEISKRVTRRNKELISSLPLTISAQHGLVDQEEFFNKQVASKDVSSYYLIKKGEFAYNKSYSNGYPWGAIKRLDRYEMGVLSTLYIVFKPTSLICSDYLVSYYDTVNWYKEVSMIAAEGARNHGLLNIAPNDFFETRLFIPSLPEQEAIGTFFSTLDQQITLHQHKLDTLKEQKKSYLKLLFPAKGQTKPALRFQGFEDDWEEVKLGEVVSISSGYTGDATLNNGKYKLTRIETISEGKVDVSRTGFSNELPDEKYRLNFGDILFSNINSLVHIGKVAIFNTMEEVFHGINLLRLVPNKDLINPYFIYYQLVTESKKNWSKAHANQAVNQASINQTSLSTQKISLPSLPEQEAIGTFFQTLDQEIAQVEDKLASLKEMKKTLLRKLFV